MTVERDDSVAQALGIIPHTAEAVLRKADHAEKVGLEIAAQYLRGYAVTLEQQQAIADAWNNPNLPLVADGLRDAVRRAMPELAAAIEDAFTKENTP